MWLPGGLRPFLLAVNCTKLTWIVVYCISLVLYCTVWYCTAQGFALHCTALRCTATQVVTVSVTVTVPVVC
jgi:hypothetical protein